MKALLAPMAFSALLAFSPQSSSVAAELGRLEIIAPAGPGGGYDQHARAMQEVLEGSGAASGVQVKNIPGAGGTIGLAQFITSKKGDPEALLIIGLGMVGAIQTNKSELTLANVTPLARLTGEYQPLVVAADSPLKTLDDLSAMFKKDPGSVSWGGFALGSPDHIVSALLVKAMGGDVAKMNSIVAGAGGEMLAQVLGGHITVATGGYNEFADQIKAGKLRLLGISAPERLAGIDGPTFKEQGLDVEFVNWRAVVGAPELAAEDKQKLDSAIGEMAKSEAWKKIAAERGWIDLYMPADEFAAFLKSEEARVGGVLKELGLVQ